MLAACQALAMTGATIVAIADEDSVREC